MKFKAFLLLSAAGRLPGMVGSLLMGYLLEGENYVGLIILVIVAVLAFLLCLLYRKKIDRYLDRIYERISH